MCAFRLINLCLLIYIGLGINGHYIDRCRKLYRQREFASSDTDACTPGSQVILIDCTDRDTFEPSCHTGGNNSLFGKIVIFRFVILI